MKKPLALLGCWVLASFAVRAGTLQLQPETVADLSRTPPVLLVHVANKGTDAARFVRAEAALGTLTVRSAPVASVGPGESVDFTLPLARLPSRPGLYQAAIRLRYADRLGFPYSAVWMADVSVGGALPADWAVGTLSEAAMAGRGTLSLSVDLLEGRRLPVTARLVLPDELACATPERRLEVQEGAPATAVFEVENRGARQGSRYLVFAVIEYVANGTNQTSVAGGLVSVEEPPYTVYRRYGLWLAASLALLMAFIFIQRRSGEPPGRPGPGQVSPCGRD